MNLRSPAVLAVAVVLFLPFCAGAEVDLPSVERVKETLEAVFERPEFQPSRPGPLMDAWVWLREKIRDAFSWLSPSRVGSAGEGLLWFLVYLLLAIVLVTVILRVSKRLLDRKSAAVAEPSRKNPARTPAAAPALSVAELAAAGRLLEAAQALYLETLLSLDKRGAARYQPAKTGGEYAHELAGTHFETPFRSLLRAFYPVAFGGRDDVRGALDAMLAAAAEFGGAR